MKLISLLPLIGAAMLQGSAPGAVHVWKSSDIHGKGELSPASSMQTRWRASYLTEGNRTFMSRTGKARD